MDLDDDADRLQRDYFWNLSRAILLARETIQIHDWWLSPGTLHSSITLPAYCANFPSRTADEEAAQGQVSTRQSARDEGKRRCQDLHHPLVGYVFHPLTFSGAKGSVVKKFRAGRRRQIATTPSNVSRLCTRISWFSDRLRISKLELSTGRTCVASSGS